MTTATPTWQELFRDQRHALLGQLACANLPAEVRSLSDEETLLVGGASESARLSSRPKASVEARAVMVTPEGSEQSLEAFQAMVQELRQAHPKAEIAGYGPLTALPGQRFAGLDRGVVLVGRAGQSFEPTPELAELGQAGVPLTAVLLYQPEVTPEAVLSAVEAIAAIAGLVSVVPLPAGAGDRIPLAGLTTSGTTDAMVTSTLRLLLPARVRVRASWAALGWKVAQVALAYGADEIAGWTAAESLAYSGRVRAASRVERQELDEGLEEAGRRNLGWP